MGTAGEEETRANSAHTLTHTHRDAQLGCEGHINRHDDEGLKKNVMQTVDAREEA